MKNFKAEKIKTAKKRKNFEGLKRFNWVVIVLALLFCTIIFYLFESLPKRLDSEVRIVKNLRSKAGGFILEYEVRAAANSVLVKYGMSDGEHSSILGSTRVAADDSGYFMFIKISDAERGDIFLESLNSMDPVAGGSRFSSFSSSEILRVEPLNEAFFSKISDKEKKNLVKLIFRNGEIKYIWIQIIEIGRAGEVVPNANRILEEP